MKAAHLGLAALIAATGTVHAQTAWTEIDDDDLLVEPIGMTVDDLEDADLYSDTGNEIGEVDEVLMGDDGTSMAVSLDVGGFLGIGEKHVAIPLDQLTRTQDGVQVGMSKDELEALPEFDD